MSEPIAVHVHRSSWQPEPSTPRSSKPAKRGSPEWLAKVIAGTRAGMRDKPRCGRAPGFVVSQATKEKLRAAAAQRYALSRKQRTA